MADTPVHRPGRLLTWPAGLCALGGLVLGIANPVVDADAQSYAGAYPATSPAEAGYHLALWHGLGLPLLASAVALVLGYALHRGWSRVGRLAGHFPRALSAQHAYEIAVGGTERVATAVTGRLQVGSVPTYLIVILVTVVALPGTAVLVGARGRTSPSTMRRCSYRLPCWRPSRRSRWCASAAGSRRCCWSGWSATASAGCSSSTAPRTSRWPSSSSRRCRWSRSCSCCAGCPSRFTLERQRARTQVPKAVIAVAAGGMVAGTAVVLSGARQVPATTSAEFIRLAPEGAGAMNVISAIIVDFRALDTVGEITVLFVAAVGVASLVLATPFDRRRRRGRESGAGSPGHEEEVIGDVAGGETRGGAGRDRAAADRA